MAPIFTDQVSQTKLIASLILFAITLLCGYLPVRILLDQNYIQYAMFAGGGVLMATAFCHLIPEAHDNYKLINTQIAQTAPSNGAKLLAITSYNGANASAQAIVDTIAANTTNMNATTFANNLLQPLALDHQNNTNNLHQHNHNNHHHHHHHHDPQNSPPSGGLNVPYLEVTLCCGFFFMYLVEQLMVRFINNHTHEHPCDTSNGRLVLVGVENETPLGHRHQHHQSNGTLTNGGSPSSAASATSGTTNVQLVSGGSTHSTVGSEFYKFIRGLLIVSAFGAHSIFDGVAIGSQETEEKVWTIFLAISCHKLIIAAVVGLELYAATLESHLWTLVHLSIFSVMSPIGILLVVLAQNSLHINSNHPAMILLQSFATGTLLYIVFVEILQPKEEHAYEKNKLGKSVSLIAGFALMLMVLTLIDE